MKYEWKNIWKAGTLMLLGMLVVTVIGCVVLRMPGGVVTGLLDNNDINATQSWFVLSSFVATLILYVIMLLASTWGMLIFLGIRFYRSMYTDEGYLSHTLPVTANQLFLSKVLVSGVWYLFITIGIGISVVALIVSLMTGLLNIGELSSVLTQYNGNIWEFMADAFYELGRRRRDGDQSVALCDHVALNLCGRTFHYYGHPVRSTDHRTAFLQT